MSTQRAEAQPPERLLYSMAEAAEKLSVGRQYLYHLQASGKIRTVKLGRRRLIPAEELDRLVANLRATGEL